MDVEDKPGKTGFSAAPLPPRPERALTHDGVIWIWPRADMRERRMIALRMAEDCRALTRDGVVDADELFALGWTREQVIGNFIWAAKDAGYPMLAQRRPRRLAAHTGPAE